MNKNTWNRLPKDIQQVITDVTNEMMPDTLCAAVTAEKELGKKGALERNNPIYEMPAAERARWVALGKPVYEKWVKDMEVKGLPGRAVYDEAVRLMNAHP
jgi:TRAP-type C4-dicarboxylate transport system substrate-binding protein